MSFEVISGYGYFSQRPYYKKTIIKKPLKTEWVPDYSVDYDAKEHFSKYATEFSFKSSETQTTQEDFVEQSKPKVTKVYTKKENTLLSKKPKTTKMPPQKKIFPNLSQIKESRGVKNAYLPIKILNIDPKTDTVTTIYPDSTETTTCSYSEAMALFPSMVAQYFLATVVKH